MLTVKQPPTYGYKSVHDLPTPPSTSRPSPPLIYQEQLHYKPFPPIPRSHSPSSQPMSAPHRGLPPPAAMTLPPQPPPQQPPPPSAAPPPPSLHSQPPPPLGPPLGPPLQQQQQQQQQPAWSTLPAPPQQWHGAEDAMRNWLHARAEEEKTRQEEERTRQETLRLEQRRVEMDILRASLGGGIPPQMIPLVFAGMGTGVLPQAALDWANQFMQSSQGHLGQQMLSQVPHSPEHQRDAPAQYTGASNTPSSLPGGYYPGSPTRPRGQTITGPPGRPVGIVSNLPNLNTNVPQPGQGLPPSAMPPHQAHHQVQAHAQQEASSSIYFHHWQPPTSQSGSSSNPPGTPSAIGDTPRKRKAVGPQPPAPAPSDARFRSPPPFVQSSLSNPPPARRGHSRRRSDVSWYRPHGAGEGRPMSPAAPGPSRERDAGELRKHSVSSMLSGEPSSASYQHGAPPHGLHQGQGGPRSPGERYGDDGSEQLRTQHQTPPSESRLGGEGHARED